MFTAHAVHRAAKNLTITLILLSTILLPISASVFQPVHANDLTVSPGKWDLRLGNNTSLVELSYPNSTILTDSVGDLLFTVTLEPNSSQFHCDITTPTASPLKRGDCEFSLNIYIPPEFTGLTITNTWTSFTNDYNPNTIRLSRQSSADEIAPNWWEVSLQNFNVTCTPLLADPRRGVFLAYPTCPGLSQPSTAITYQTKPQYIRLFQVTSPTTAGRYFFKAFINGQSIGANNFPTLVVKASRDPATISGTLRDLGNRIPSRAGRPIFLAPGMGAEIIATGYTALGQSVSAQTFINSTAGGSYTLYGVAAGTYNITVYAAGYIPTTINQLPYPYPFNPSITRPTPISVGPAQSLEGIDIYLSESANVTGTVLSQTASGRPVRWGTVCSLT
ncbi:MAG TPA: carboxypeptidase-like regulatory domain-containing protein, partial [Candidatus Dormibacteraeota bacterium]|nr:carboxypeptidase-like regulatory domain-containing protein [Candidatus Dormibacteraeota bacterium]